MRVAALFLAPVWLTLACGTAMAANEPLEKQFFDYFTGTCEKAMKDEWTAQNRDINNPALQSVMVKYCSCTSQAVVSNLTAEEIIAFAIAPEQEPAASKMKPLFLECQERARKLTE